MNVSELSNGGLYALWSSVKDAFNADMESISLGSTPKYGVKDFKDWRQWSDELESEMVKRSLEFAPIPW